ncbi:hypothetical protein [Streptomyces mayteni]
MAERDTRVIDFLYELGLLKRHKRTGWLIAGVPEAIEYREQGNRQTQPWIDTSLAALTTVSAKQLAHDALGRGPLEWMHRARTEKPEL